LRATRLSPAALNRYRTCPKSFLLTDIERLPRGETRSTHLAQGTAVHHALERFFGLPVADRSADTIEQALRAVWAEHRKRAGFRSREEEAVHGLAAIAMLREFANSYDITVEPIAREQWVETRLPNGIELFGKVDRIDRFASGGLDVVDYKTGRHMVEPEDMDGEPAAQIYLLATEDTYSSPVERVRFIYLATGQEVSWSPEREDVEALRENLARLAERLVAETEFEAVPGFACRTCPVAIHCPERQRVSLDDLVVEAALPF
jgi:putative RecB family exonuclease